MFCETNKQKKEGYEIYARRFRVIKIAALFFLVLLSLHDNPSFAADAQSPPERTITVLHSFKARQPWVSLFNGYLMEQLRERISFPYKIEIENLDLVDFNDPQYKKILMQQLEYKYSKHRPDILLATFEPAIRLVLEHDFFRNIPKIFVLPSVTKLTENSGAVVIHFAYDFKGSVESILTLIPDTREIYVVAGNAAIDGNTASMFAQETMGLSDQISFHYFDGVRTEEVLDRLGRLPPDSVVYYLSYSQDDQGRAVVAKDFCTTVGIRSNRPVFTYLDLFALDTGIVGGRVTTTKASAATTVSAIKSLFQGQAIESIKPELPEFEYIYDWRQLQRWSIRESDLPAGAIVRYKDLSVWDLYKWHIIGLIGLVLIEGTLIFILLIQRTRRRHAELLLQKARDELELRLFELKQTQEKLQSILNKTPDIIYRLDPEGNVTYISDAVSNFGYQPDDIVGKPFTDFFHPDNTETIGHILRERRTGERSTHDLEVRFMIGNAAQKQRATGLMDSHWSTFLISSDGLYADDIVSPATYRGTQGLARDISRTRHIETRVAQLASVVEQAAENVVIFDPDGAIQYVNPRYEEMTGYSRSEVIGQTLQILNSKRSESDFYTKILHSLDSGNIWKGRIRTQTRDGREILQDVTITSIYGPVGNLTGYALVGRDVTKQVEIEEQLRQSQKMEAIGRLAGGIAHDFNNILSGIIGYAELALIDIGENEPGRKKIGRILEASSRATDLIRQILTFSRSEKTNPMPVNPCIIIKEVLKLIRASLPATIEINQSLNSQSTVLADPISIHQIIMNLCTNAGHAMRKAGGILTVSSEDVTLEENEVASYPDLDAGRFVKISVADTGHGISPDIQSKIFDPFFTTKGQGRGTGMGLSTVHGTVRNLGGMVTVNSKSGVGSKFNVFLPIIEKPIEITDYSKPQAALRGTERILFVDDESIQGELARDSLSPLGYRVKIFSDSIAAWEHFQAYSDEYDIVVTDMTMPKMTGDVLTLNIHRLKPEIPVIMCTGFSKALDQKKIEAMGLRAFLHKPIVARELTRIIRDIMD